MKTVFYTFMCLWANLGLAAQDRPVTKVINLLQDMLKQLQKEAEEDEDIYDKMACWCETNDKEKTAAIAAAEARITDLTTSVEELAAGSARLTTEIANHEAELKKDQDALEEAKALREKQLAEFNGEEKDMLESVAALKAAITVLSKHNGGALVQVPRSHLLAVAATVQHELQAHARLLAGVLTPSQRRTALAFSQEPDQFDKKPTFKQAYGPQSGEIFGILKQMKETFEENLSASQKQEIKNQAAFEDLKAAKEDEIAAGQQQIDAKTSELATTDSKHAQAKQDIEDTKNSLSADEQFLLMLKEKCAMTDKEWEVRQKTRQSEITAVSEALKVLSTDDAHDTFTRTFTLLQLDDASLSQRRSKASQLLESMQSPRLAALAAQVRLRPFTKVKAAIDKMVAALTKEKDDEVKKKDFCVGGLHENEIKTEKKTHEKEGLMGKIDTLNSDIQALTKAIETLTKEVNDAKVELKNAEEERAKQKAIFEQVVKDQRETMRLLKAAQDILKKVYDKQTSFAQQAGPPPPAGFETYSKNAGSSGVLGLIQQILNDAKAMETDALKDEEDAKTAYGVFVLDTNDVIDVKTKDIVNKDQTKAKKTGMLVQTEEELFDAKTDLEQLDTGRQVLRNDCDFLLNNFDDRQAARDDEIEALRQAKAILSGAKFQQALDAGGA